MEINPILVRSSRKHIAHKKLDALISIEHKSLWDVDLGQYDVVFLYGTSYIMKKLEKKVLNEMKHGSQVISNYFRFPNLKPNKTLNNVLLYKI